MRIELIIYCSIAAFLTLIQAIAAQSPRNAKTVYQLLDRVSWIFGGALAIAIGFWNPWFTTTWWKAIINSLWIFFLMSSLPMVFLGDALYESKLPITRVLTHLVLGSVLFFLFRACGK